MHEVMRLRYGYSVNLYGKNGCHDLQLPVLASFAVKRSQRSHENKSSVECYYSKNL